MPSERRQGKGLSGVAPVAAADARARRAAEQGDAAFKRGDAATAVARLQEAVSLDPADPKYHLQLAAAARRVRRLDLVERHLLEAIRLAPNDPTAHYFLGTWHYQHDRIDAALEHSARAVALAPDDPTLVLGYATILLAAGRAREAGAALERLAAADVPDRWAASLFARAAARGQEERALDVVRRALRAPGLGPQPDGKPMLHFAAATMLDRLGRYDEAFAEARLANDTARTAVRKHDPAAHSEWVSAKTRYFTAERVKSLPRATAGGRRPVFIVGMPRSGTSLVEQILARHPQVHGAGELNALRLVAKAAAEADWSPGTRYPDALESLPPARADAFAEQYLAGAPAPPGAGVTYVTDKQPLNFLLLDLVEVLFPDSHVIHCVRNPLDTCLSCYLTNFEQSNAFKFDLGHLGAYYQEYRRLMDHWKSVLTVPILDVNYEDVVRDTEGQARRLLAFLELPWDERCLRYYESDRRVKTASVDQVRRPIYTSSIGRWKHYEQHLGELIAAMATSTG